jgi:molecular chaperone GrpE (heat shock protein)
MTREEAIQYLEEAGQIRGAARLAGMVASTFRRRLDALGVDPFQYIPSPEDVHGGAFMSKQENERIARMIVQYWGRKGYQVKAQVLRDKVHIPSARCRPWIVVTDLVNGLPRDYHVDVPVNL